MSNTSCGDADGFDRGNVTLVSEVLKFPLLMVAVVIFNSRQDTWEMRAWRGFMVWTYICNIGVAIGATHAYIHTVVSFSINVMCSCERCIIL